MLAAEKALASGDGDEPDGSEVTVSIDAKKA